LEGTEKRVREGKKKHTQGKRIHPFILLEEENCEKKKIAGRVDSCSILLRPSKFHSS